MKYQTTTLNEYGKTKIGSFDLDQCGNKKRIIKCKGIHLGEDGFYYAHWQYVLSKTLKPSGKSTSFLRKIYPI